MSQQTSFYPRVDFPNPDTNSPFSNPSPSSSSMYPSIHTNNVAASDIILDHAEEDSKATLATEHVLVTVPGAILHLIEKDSSVHLASGDLTIVSLREGKKVVAVLASVGEQIMWPLAKDVSVVKLDEAHYFFTVRVPEKNGMEVLNYGLTVGARGQERVVKELDEVLEKYSFLTEERVEGVRGWEVLDESVWKREAVEERSAAYWTTVAPNVEDYSGRFARWIAAGSGQVVRGILWVGDVTVERLKWGDDFLKKRLQPGSHSQVSPQALERVQRF